MQLIRRAVGTFITAALLVVGLAPGAFAASEDSLLARINEERGARGLPALVSHWDLADDAEAHSQVMMAGENLHHNPNLGSVTTGWLSLGENVGVGPTVSSIHTAFMASPPHRGNVLGDFTHVGIGAVRASENRMWVTVVFMKASGSATTTTSTTTSTTAMAPPPTTSPAAVAAPPSTGAPTPPPIAALPATRAAADAPAVEPPVEMATFVRVRHRHMPRPM